MIVSVWGISLLQGEDAFIKQFIHINTGACAPRTVGRAHICLSNIYHGGSEHYDDMMVGQIKITVDEKI